MSPPSPLGCHPALIKSLALRELRRFPTNRHIALTRTTALRAVFTTALACTTALRAVFTTALARTTALRAVFTTKGVSSRPQFGELAYLNVSSPPRGTMNPGKYMLLRLLVGFSLFTNPVWAQDDPEEVVFEAIEAALIEAEVADVPPANQADQKQPVPDFVKPIVNRELSFIKRVCRPTPEQMNKIVAQAKEAMNKMGDLVKANQNGGFVINANEAMIMGPNGEQLSESPHQRVENDLKQLLPKCVSKDQHQRYLEETKTRREYRRRAAISIAVGIVDEKVALNDQQYRDLTQRLTDDWDKASLLRMVNYLQNPEYIPDLPKGQLKEALSKDQYKAWNSYQTVTMWSNFQPPQVDEMEKWIK